jgi:hypothetical protein
MTDLDERLSRRFREAGDMIDPQLSGDEVARSLGSRALQTSSGVERSKHRTLVGAGLAVFVVVVIGVLALALLPGDPHEPLTTPNDPPGTTPSTEATTDFVPTGVTPRIPEGCVALHGSDPWITIHENGPNPGLCVAIAADGTALIFNKGHDTVTIDGLPAGAISIGSDDWRWIVPAVDHLGPGVHRFTSSPYVMPEIWVVPRSESPLATLPLEIEGFGPFRLGMTIQEAQAAWGGELTVAESFAPGPRCWGASVPDDPYSPILIVEGDGGPQSRIEQIWVELPGQPSVGGIEVGMTEDEVRARAMDAGYNLAQWAEGGNVLEWTDEGQAGIELTAPDGQRVLVAAFLTGTELSGPDAPPASDRVRRLTVSSPNAFCSGPAPFSRS